MYIHGLGTHNKCYTGRLKKNQVPQARQAWRAVKPSERISTHSATTKYINVMRQQAF